jgi:hypothetical protein
LQQASRTRLLPGPFGTKSDLISRYKASTLPDVTDMPLHGKSFVADRLSGGSGDNFSVVNPATGETLVVAFRNQNTRKIWRLVNGQLTKDDA